MKTARARAQRIVKDESLHIIQNDRRRAFIRVLRELGGEACLREVIRRVARWESPNPSKRLEKSIYTGMIQNHLPKMREAGIVEYDQMTDTVRLVRLTREYRYHLEVVERGEVPWCLYYLALSIFGVFASLLFAAWSGFWMASLFTLAFSSCVMVSALVHTARTYGVSGIELIPMGIEAITKRIKKLGIIRRKPERDDLVMSPQEGECKEWEE